MLLGFEVMFSYEAHWLAGYLGVLELSDHRGFCHCSAIAMTRIQLEIYNALLPTIHKEDSHARLF